jgi:hypothetical protein
MTHVRWQLDLDMGKLTWPKDDDGRWFVMSPRFRAHLETMPRREERRSTAPRARLCSQQRAMDDYVQRGAAAETPRRLHVVRSA